MKPGPGWTHVSGAVWDHTSGIRIHVAGWCRFPGGELVNGKQWPECRELDRCVAICGGNRRRGVMVWAMQEWKEMQEGR